MDFIYGIYPLLCVTAFLFIGFKYGLWHPAWLVFVSIPVFYSVMDCITKKKISGLYFALCVIVYVILGLTLKLWHPLWIIFLTVPLVEWFIKTCFKKR